MKRVALVPVLLLAACAHSEPAVDVRTVEVPVIRVDKCVATKDIPARPAPLPKRPKSISAAVDLLLAKVRSWELWGDKVDPLLRGCATD